MASEAPPLAAPAQAPAPDAKMEEPHVHAAMSLCALGRTSRSASPAPNGGGDPMNLSEPMPPLPGISGAPPSKKAAPAKKGTTSKHALKGKSRDPRRDTSVPFDEMKRLMRVYGSLKCLRNRTSSASDKAASVKPESVKRKFYRWFPDLDERFERTEGAKAGHEAEMAYREGMRKADQESLVKKRNSKRASGKLAKEV
ncbi:hypothetical protein ACHAXT_010430 [Thalassiosira profunda]